MPWDTAFEGSPPESQDHGRGGERIRETKTTARARLAVQHNVGDATVTTGYTDDGRHNPGSAVAFYGGTEAAPRPTTLWKPDGTALSTIPAGSVNLGSTDRGRLWVDEGGAVPVLRYYSSHFSGRTWMATQPPINALINGGFSVWQRGGGVTTCVAGATHPLTGSLGTYTADRWFVQPVGGNPTVQPGGGFRTPLALLVNGVAGVTECWVGQRIESADIVRIRNIMNGSADALMTFSFRIANSSGAAITPQYRVDYPAAASDTFSAVTNAIAATNLTAVADGGNVYQTVTIDLRNLSANIGRGIQILINLGALVTGSVVLYEAMLETGGDRSLYTSSRFGDELLMCQRYFQKTHLYGTPAGQNFGNAGAFAIQGSTCSNWELYPTMRTTPFVTTYNTNAADALFDNDTGGADGAVTIPATGTANGDSNVTILAPGAITDRYSGHLSADAEL